MRRDIMLIGTSVREFEEVVECLEVIHGEGWLKGHDKVVIDNSVIGLALDHYLTHLKKRIDKVEEK